MRVKLRLNVKALSINATYYANRNHGKTAEAKVWTAQVCTEINRYYEQIKLIRDNFDADKHVFAINLKFITPKFYTADGKLSAHSMDISNIEKSIIDILFIPSYNGNGIYQCDNLDIDDKYITSMLSTKEYGLDYAIEVTLKLKKFNARI